MLKRIVCATILLAAASVHSIAAEYYVSPSGKPAGPGAKDTPYDLATVFSGAAPVRPGDTVWLLGGVYELPKCTTNAQYKDAYTIETRLTGSPDKPIIVRQAPGERATISGGLQVLGADTWYWGFEVLGTRGTDRDAGNREVNVFAPRAKMINLVVHRGSQGFGFWTPAENADLYGNIVYDFGEPGKDAKDRGHGHSCYTQNNTGIKRIIDNVMFGGYGWNIHAYTQGGQIKGYLIEGNILFCPGMNSRVDDAVKENIIIAGYPPADNFTVVNNVAYSPRRGPSGRANFRLSTYGKASNGTCVVKDNYLAGQAGLIVSPWMKASVTGNEIISGAGRPIIQTGKGPDAKAEDWIVNKNTYWAFPTETRFNGKTFAEYQQATGFDADSRLVAPVNDSDRPTGTRTFVRPNKYEPGRAYIAVFNWDRKDAVEIDLAETGLKNGQKFQVRNMQDLYGKPVVEATYTGKPVSVKMLKSDIAPDFDAFLVIPEESFTCFTSRPGELKPDWTKVDWKTALNPPPAPAKE